MANGNDEITVKIFDTSVEGATNVSPGTLSLQKNRMMIACGDRWLEIKQLQAAGKKRMTAAEFLRGIDLSPYTAL